MKKVYKFSFKRHVSKREIEERLAIAMITAECVYGQARVRLHVAYTAANARAVLEVSGAVGEHIAQVFTGLMIKLVGEKAFAVECCGIAGKRGGRRHD